MEASYQRLKTFSTTQGNLVMRFCIHNMFTNKRALPFYRSLGPQYVLWPFTTSHYSRPPPPTPTALCILNFEFHTGFLSHLVFLCRVRQLLGTASIVPSSILVTMMKEETSILTRATWRNIREDAILPSHHRENLKFYKMRWLAEHL
jgi:hypothetical protein